MKHGKVNELVCITCKKKICHNCALFGEHKGHDVKEFQEAMKEVVVRTEVLMEMFEQVDQEFARVQADQTLQNLLSSFNASKNNLKEQVTKKFDSWREILSLMEQNVHVEIDKKFQQFEKNFDDEEKVV